MGKEDRRVDAYIAKSADFAQPVLRHIRRLVHAACPEVEETIKWGFPHFTYHGILACMAAFKQHCAFGFWHRGMHEYLPGDEKTNGMNSFGRIAAIADLPTAAQFNRYVKLAMQLNASGIKARVAKPKTKKKVSIPQDFARALAKNKKSLATMQRFSESHRREYVEWIEEAKRDETRAKRLATAIKWLAAGKPRNWKYIKK